MSSQSKHAAGAVAGNGFGVIAATAIVAVGSIAMVFLSSPPSEAAEPSATASGRVHQSIESPLTRLNAGAGPLARGTAASPQEPIANRYPPPPIPRFEPRRLLGPADEIAALEAVQIALSEVGDGASYVWHRDHGRLSGVVKPTSSYLGPGGQICRHLLVLLTSGDYARRAEGVACRDGQGIWSLDG